MRLHRPPSASSKRLESPQCVTYILGKRMLLVAVHALAHHLPQLGVPRGSQLASVGIISLLDQTQEPSTACKAGADTVHLHHPDIREGGQLLPAARLSVDAQGRSDWRISFRCVLLSICVHHSPKTKKNV